MIALLLSVGSVRGAAQGSCTVGSPIPAYAHNDYENEHPLYDALALGYQGVEADVHLVRGQLLVAHDRFQVSDDRTLESLYLAPLAARVHRCGTVLHGGTPLLLNVEIKTGEERAYRALRRLLGRYRGMLTTVTAGVEHVGPVQVVLVGWHPPVEALAEEPERLTAVQWMIRRPDDRVPDAPAHLIRLVSLDYGTTIGWSGSGVRPAAVRAMLEALSGARDAAPGRVARVYDVPLDATVYRVLLEFGVDLVGTKDLAGTRTLLGTRD